MLLGGFWVPVTVSTGRGIQVRSQMGSASTMAILVFICSPLLCEGEHLLERRAEVIELQGS